MSIFDIFRRDAGWSFKKDPQEEKLAAPYVPPENDDAAFVVGANYYGQYRYTLNTDQNFQNEADLILKYREIALQPEVDSAVVDITNEAITGDDDSCPVEIVTDDLKNELPQKVIDIIHKEFEHLLELLDFNSNAYEIFRKWYVDGRIAYLMIIDPKAPKEGIQELRHIPSINIKKIREEKNATLKDGIEIVTSYEEYYLYGRDINKEKNVNTTSNSKNFLKLTKDSVAFCHSGLVDEKEGKIYSYLHKCLKPANQLRMLEDALLIYTLARAPQRRIFYVDVGNMQKTKAEEYLKSIQNRYKNKMVYDSMTGQIKDSAATMSMMEDFWLPRVNGSKGTEIGTLDGLSVIGGTELLDYFKKKLYQSLYVPPSRISGEAAEGFSVGRPSEITREEIKFSKFVSRLRKRFSTLFMDLLKTQLLLKQIITKQEWEIIKNKISFNYLSDVHFRELKDADIMKERMVLLEEVQPYVGVYFSMEYVRKKILQQTDEDIENMKKQMVEEEEEIEEMQRKMNPEQFQDENDEVPPEEGEDGAVVDGMDGEIPYPQDRDGDLEDLNNFVEIPDTQKTK